MSQPSLNGSTGFDLEDYERKLLSTSKSFSNDFAVSFGNSDTASLLEAYEKKMLSGGMMLIDEDHSAVTDINDRFFARQQNVDYFDWVSKLGKGDSNYDQQAVDWIKNNRAAVVDYPGLVKVKYPRTATNYTGYNYNGHSNTDPAPNWNVTNAAQAAVYEGIRRELFGEGGASSINTYDDQLLTIGWGFSVKNELGRSVLLKNMQASQSFKEKLLAVGMNVDAASVYYVHTDSKTILTGEAALQKIRWDQKVLSQLIRAFEADMTGNVASQVAVFKQFRMSDFPAEGFSWPVDSVRLAVHLKHWLPVGIQWAAIKGSGGNVATIIKHFCRNIYQYQESNNKSNYFLRISKLANNALYADDRDHRFHMGNNAMEKAAAAGTISTTTSFNDNYKTNSQYNDYVFIDYNGKIYLLS